MRRFTAIGAVTLTLGVGATAIAHAAVARTATETGGLAITPALLAAPATPGALGTMSVENHSSKPLSVTVAARPWTETSTGAIAVDRKHSLAAQVRLSATSFTLAPGATAPVSLSLLAAPSGGALYGAVEVIGLPAGAAKQKGIVLGYRLIGSLRLTPTASKYALAAGAVKVSSAHAVTLPIKSTGNTIDPVTGTVRVKGATGTNNYSINAVKILPGDTISPSLGKHAKGTYTATVTLTQGGKKQLSATRKFSVH
jgi:hypothetical protein